MIIKNTCICFFIALFSFFQFAQAAPPTGGQIQAGQNAIQKEVSDLQKELESLQSAVVAKGCLFQIENQGYVVFVNVANIYAVTLNKKQPNIIRYEYKDTVVDVSYGSEQAALLKIQILDRKTALCMRR